MKRVLAAFSFALSRLRDLWDNVQCLLGNHDWTCKAQQGIQPTPEQLTGDLVRGFREYSKMYCKHCLVESELNDLYWRGR